MVSREVNCYFTYLMYIDHPLEGISKVPFAGRCSLTRWRGKQLLEAHRAIFGFQKCVCPISCLIAKTVTYPALPRRQFPMTPSEQNPNAQPRLNDPKAMQDPKTANMLYPRCDGMMIKCSLNDYVWCGLPTPFQAVSPSAHRYTSSSYNSWALISPFHIYT